MCGSPISRLRRCTALLQMHRGSMPDMSATARTAAPSASPAQYERTIPTNSAATLYFVVFLCNRSPIFHSNRIPLREDTPPYTAGDILYFGPAEVVAQQKLQELAFPLGFGCKSSLTRNGPLWSSRIESIRRKDSLRYHRLMITSTFVVSVAAESGGLRTMQTKYAAVALVVTCPSDKPYLQFLVENFDSVVRNMLHVALDFGMKATQLLFMKLSETKSIESLVTELERGPQALLTYQTLGAILVNALAYKDSFPRLHTRMGELTVFRLFSLQKQEEETVKTTVDALLNDALRFLCGFSLPFTSRFIAGLLSVSNWERCAPSPFSLEAGKKGSRGREEEVEEDIIHDGHKNDMYSDYWKCMQESEKKTDELLSPVGEQCSKINGDHNGNSNGNSDNNNSSSTEDAPDAFSEAHSPISMTMPSSQPTDAFFASYRDTNTQNNSSPTPDAVCPLSSHREGRVVIFSTDPKLAQCLLILSAFFFRDRRAVMGISGRQNDEVPFAGKVCSYASPSLPVQWVMEEYDESCRNRLMSSPHSVDNVLLLVAPRSMVCSRIRLEKTFSLTPILVEKFKKNIQLVHPFQQRALSLVKMLPDKMISWAVQESRRLQEKSHGAVSCAVFLDCFISWLLRESHLCRLRKQIRRPADPSVSLSVASTPSRGEEWEPSRRLGSSVTRFISLLRPRPSSNSLGSATSAASGAQTTCPPRHAGRSELDMMFGCTHEDSQLMSLLTEG